MPEEPGTPRAFERSEEGWAIPVAGTLVTMLRIDFRLTMDLRVTHEDSAGIVIEQPFVYRSPEGEIAITPDEVATLAPILELFNREVTSAWATNDGWLYIRFAGEREIDVGFDPNYDAWQATLQSGEMLVCTPGGSVSHYGPERRSTQSVGGPI